MIILDNCSLLNGHRQLVWGGVNGKLEAHVHQPFSHFSLLVSWKDYFGSHPSCPYWILYHLDYVLFSHFSLILLSCK